MKNFGMKRVTSTELRRNDALGMGSAPAPGAAGRALAACRGAYERPHGQGRAGALEFGARARRTTAGAAVVPARFDFLRRV